MLRYLFAIILCITTSSCTPIFRLSEEVIERGLEDVIEEKNTLKTVPLNAKVVAWLPF